VKVAAPKDRRFRRAHVKPARRRGRVAAIVRPALKALAILAFVVYGLYTAGSVAAHAGMLQIDDIVVSGNSRLSNGEVIEALSGLRGENIVLVDLAAWRRRLLATPWIRDASLRRSLPSTIEVVVTEREPMAVGRISGELYLVDDRGMVIDQYGPVYAGLDLPIVDGLAAQSTGGAMLDEARADLAARFLGAVRSDLEVAKELSQVDVNDLRNVKVMLNNDPAIVHVGDDRFLPRLRTYLQLAGTLRERVPEIDYVDLRFDDRIYVRPARGGR
jgi:cell division septal protein FtsQ